MNKIQSDYFSAVIEKKEIEKCSDVLDDLDDSLDSDILELNNRPSFFEKLIQKSEENSEVKEISRNVYRRRCK